MTLGENRLLLGTDQVRQGHAVQVLVHHPVQPFPQGEGPAVAGLFAALLLPFQAGDGGQAPLRQAEDLSRLPVGSSARSKAGSGSIAAAISTR